MGMVYLSLLVRRINGIKRLFQENTNVKIAWVAIAGFIIGRMILLKVLNSPDPSILAEFTMSNERLANKYWRMKKTIAGVAIEGIIKGQNVFTQPIRYII